VDYFINSKVSSFDCLPNYSEMFSVMCHKHIPLLSFLFGHYSVKRLQHGEIVAFSVSNLALNSASVKTPFSINSFTVASDIAKLLTMGSSIVRFVSVFRRPSVLPVVMIMLA
jgi:hypothetical protein